MKVVLLAAQWHLGHRFTLMFLRVSSRERCGHTLAKRSEFVLRNEAKGLDVKRKTWFYCLCNCWRPTVPEGFSFPMPLLLSWNISLCVRPHLGGMTLLLTVTEIGNRWHLALVVQNPILWKETCFYKRFLSRSFRCFTCPKFVTKLVPALGDQRNCLVAPGLESWVSTCGALGFHACHFCVVTQNVQNIFKLCLSWEHCRRGRCLPCQWKSEPRWK